MWRFVCHRCPAEYVVYDTSNEANPTGDCSKYSPVYLQRVHARTLQRISYTLLYNFDPQTTHSNGAFSVRIETVHHVHPCTTSYYCNTVVSSQNILTSLGFSSLERFLRYAVHWSQWLYCHQRALQAAQHTVGTWQWQLYGRDDLSLCVWRRLDLRQRRGRKHVS